MNRKTLTTLIELAGAISLSVGAFQISTGLGLIAVGIIAILVGEANA